jgi:hypothetical protein
VVCGDDDVGQIQGGLVIDEDAAPGTDPVGARWPGITVLDGQRRKLHGMPGQYFDVENPVGGIAVDDRRGRARADDCQIAADIQVTRHGVVFAKSGLGEDKGAARKGDAVGAGVGVRLLHGRAQGAGAHGSVADTIPDVVVDQVGNVIDGIGVGQGRQRHGEDDGERRRECGETAGEFGHGGFLQTGMSAGQPLHSAGSRSSASSVDAQFCPWLADGAHASESWKTRTLRISRMHRVRLARVLQRNPQLPCPR